MLPSRPCLSPSRPLTALQCSPTAQPFSPAHLDEAPARVAALSQHPQHQRLHIRQTDGALLAAQLHGSSRLQQGGRQLKRTQRRDSTAARCGSIRGWRPQQAQAFRQLASLAAGSGCCSIVARQEDRTQEARDLTPLPYTSTKPAAAAFFFFFLPPPPRPLNPFVSGSA